jgi:hypothetical protein
MQLLESNILIYDVFDVFRTGGFIFRKMVVRAGMVYLSIYLSCFITAVAVFRKPNTIPLCFSIDLVLNFLLSWLLVLLVAMFFLDILFSFSPVVHAGTVYYVLHAQITIKSYLRIKYLNFLNTSI